jgi:hypothetical protein
MFNPSSYIHEGRFPIAILGLALILYLNQSPPLRQDQVSCSSMNVTDTNCFRKTTNLSYASTANNNGTSTFPLDLQSISSPQVVFKRKQGCNNESGGCRLELLHIPKTGGTAVEFAASSANISWGACKFWGKAFGKPCGSESSRRPAGNKKPQFMTFHPSTTSGWHLPAQYYHFEADNPYENAALFAIVRNPYDRVISECFFTHEILLRQRNATALNNVTRMNAWISERLTRMINNTVYELPLIVPSGPHEKSSFPGQDYFQNDGHFIPQIDYIFDGARRVVDHVLHFEHLSVEFPKLMMAYNLSVHLPNLTQGDRDNRNHGTPSRVPTSKLKKVGRNNLTSDTLRLMELVYARDFKAFGYQIISY